MASTAMEIILLIANMLLICRHPISTKGKLISTNKIGSEMPVARLVSKEMPVTPPSINPFGIKNPSKPNAAEEIPTAINKAFLIAFHSTLFATSVPLAI